MIKIILLDKQDITREGIKYIIQNTISSIIKQTIMPEIQFDIEEISEEKQLSHSLQNNPETILILDFTLINITAENLIVLQQRFPKVRFILFSDNLSKDFIRRMLFTSKAFSILLKDANIEEITECIRQVIYERQYAAPKVISWIEQKETKEHISLTATEREILKAMSLGKTTKEIASERFSSVHTIMTHRKNIFRKLDVNNSQEAIRCALRAGIIDVMEYYI